jgi:hypothetical protein
MDIPYKEDGDDNNDDDDEEDNNSIQFFIYLRADSTAIAFYRVSTDTYNRNSGQHKDNVQKQHTKTKIRTSCLCRQVPNVYVTFN